MSSKKAGLWSALVVVLLILLIAAVSIPNLIRAKISANEATRIARLRTLEMEQATSEEPRDTQKGQAAGADRATPDGRKIVYTAALDLIVANVQEVTARIQILAESAGGYVEKSEFTQSYAERQSAEIVIRVPQNSLGGIRGEIKKLAQRVNADKSEARDVTREFIDSEARLRNMRAEEAQYLELMHRAGSVKDVIDITSRLSDVRGRIEQLTSELRYLSHQVEMSSIVISLSTEYIPSDKIEWHPIRRIQLAFHDMVEGLSDYADAMISFVLFTPVILLWTATVLFVVVVAWRILRWMWRKFIRTGKSAATVS